MLRKRRSLRIIRRLLSEELQPNQVKIPFMLIIILKSESVCRFCNLYPESNNLLHSSYRWIFYCKFLVYDEMENISMNKISINLTHSSNSRKLSRQKFHNELACVFTACLLCKQKCRLKSTTTNGIWRHFGQSEQCKSSVLFSIQSEKSPDSGFFACDL